MNVFQIDIRYSHACPKTTAGLNVNVYSGVYDFRGVERIPMNEIIVEKLYSKVSHIANEIFLLTEFKKFGDKSFDLEIPDDVMGLEVCKISVKIKELPDNIILYRQWRGSGKTFAEFVKPGTPVDEEMIDYFIGVVPPRNWSSNFYFQVGEPANTKENGLTWDTFKYDHEKGVWVYKGECYSGKYEHIA